MAWTDITQLLSKQALKEHFDPSEYKLNSLFATAARYI